MPEPHLFPAEVRHALAVMEYHRRDTILAMLFDGPKTFDDLHSRLGYRSRIMRTHLYKLAKVGLIKMSYAEKGNTVTEIYELTGFAIMLIQGLNAAVSGFGDKLETEKDGMDTDRAP